MERVDLIFCFFSELSHIVLGDTSIDANRRDFFVEQKENKKKHLCVDRLPIGKCTPRRSTPEFYRALLFFQVFHECAKKNQQIVVKIVRWYYQLVWT